MSDSKEPLLAEQVKEPDVDIPVLDKIVRPTDTSNLVDLLIKIIQTNSGEDDTSLREYRADVGLAALLDIDDTLSSVLDKPASGQPLASQPATQPTAAETEADIPVLLESNKVVQTSSRLDQLSESERATFEEQLRARSQLVADEVLERHTLAINKEMKVLVHSLKNELLDNILETHSLAPDKNKETDQALEPNDL